MKAFAKEAFDCENREDTNLPSCHEVNKMISMKGLGNRYAYLVRPASFTTKPTRFEVVNLQSFTNEFPRQQS